MKEYNIKTLTEEHEPKSGAGICSRKPNRFAYRSTETDSPTAVTTNEHGESSSSSSSKFV
jgi:hypothetical protein